MFRGRLEALYRGQVVADDRLALLLKLVESEGSILRAARRLGMSYSRAWEAIARAERLLGVRLVEARRGGRGGGGARLTRDGRMLVELFEREYRRLLRASLESLLGGGEGGAGGHTPDIVYAGSHDLALEMLAGLLRSEGVNVELHWIGSLNGVKAVAMGEADFAGVHVLDPATGSYNVHLLHGYRPHLLLVRGYRRLVGLASREPLDADEALEKLVRGELRLANRVRGSGTRLLMDYLLEKTAKRLGVDLATLPARVKGYETEAATHVEAASMVARGEADIALVAEWAANLYKLEFTPIAWEDFDLLVAAASLHREQAKKLVDKLASREFREKLETMKGYQPHPDTGKIIG